MFGSDALTAETYTRFWRSLALRIGAALFALATMPTFAQDAKGTGLLFLDEGSYRSIPLAATPHMGSIPAQVDMSRRFPVPGDQGGQGSCVGWAVAYLKSFQEAVERHWDPRGSGAMFSPAYIYNQIKLSSSCTSGSYIPSALNLVRSDGAALLNQFPYEERACSAMPSMGLTQHAKQFALSDWRRVNPQDISEVQAQLAAGFPVLIGMIVDTAFQELRDGRTYTQAGGRVEGGHAMVIVGYGDDKQAFKVINSWGREWGDDGFGWIGYEVFRQKVREAYVVQDIVVYKPELEREVNPEPEMKPDLTIDPEDQAPTRYSSFDSAIIGAYNSQCLVPQNDGNRRLSQSFRCSGMNCVFRQEVLYPSGEIAYNEIEFALDGVREIVLLAPTRTTPQIRCNGYCISHTTKKHDWRGPESRIARLISLPNMTRQCAELFRSAFH